MRSLPCQFEHPGFALRRLCWHSTVAAAVWLLVFRLLTLDVSADELSRLPQVSAPGLPLYGCRVVRAWDHNPEAFTQGLVYHGGCLFESTGLRGASSLRKFDLAAGREVKLLRLPRRYFAEGLTMFGRRLFQLTWTSGACFVYGVDSFDLQRTFSYAGEGWGLTHDGRHLIMSDGSSRLQFIDPETFSVEGEVEVQLLGRPLTRLNELEYVRGEVLANVWQTRSIVRIDTGSGRVTGVIDLTGLDSGFSPLRRVDVPNGIAYDAAGDRLFVTGKLWPKIFQVALVPLQGGAHDGR